MTATTQFNMTDYDQEYANFKWEVPEYYNFAGEVIDHWAQDSAKLAMLWVDDFGTEIRKTFAELRHRSHRADHYQDPQEGFWYFQDIRRVKSDQ